jgi:hypothetical protein
VGAFGTRGRGPGELANAAPPISYLPNEIWAYDPSMMRMCQIDVEKSLQTKACYFNKIIRVPWMSFNCIPFPNDSLIMVETLKNDAGNFDLLLYNYRKSYVEDTINLYRYNIANIVDMMVTYNSHWKIKPDGKKAVSAMHAMSQINIVNFENKKKLAIEVFPKGETIDDVIDIHTHSSKWAYYINIKVTDNLIYATYLNKQKGSSESVQNTEIHVFDWQGSPVCRYIIPGHMKAITIDENNNILYGLLRSDNRKVYRYKMD